MASSINIPSWLFERRRRLALSQEALALLLDVSGNTIARWERGESQTAHPKMLLAALSSIERDHALKSIPQSDAERLTVIKECLINVRQSVRYGQAAMPFGPDSQGDPFTNVDLFVKHANHADRCLLLLERAAWPKGFNEARKAGQGFRKVWGTNKVVQLRNAIEHREEVIWNKNHPLRGIPITESTFLGEQIPSFSGDGFTGDTNGGPEYVRYLGVNYRLAGVWAALVTFRDALSAIVVDEHDNLRAQRA